MEISETNQEPYILLKQAAVSQWRHTPLSALLSVCGLVLPFLLWSESIFAYVLVLSPLFLGQPSRILGVGLGVSVCLSLIWGQMEEHALVMEGVVLVDAIYLFTSRKEAKYRMIPKRVINQGFPVLL